MSENELAVSKDIKEVAKPSSGHVFSSIQSFEDAQRMVKALTSSNIVPKDFQGERGVGNAMIALEMAQRIGASPMAVMQNLHIIHGKPSWSSQFIIASLNSCGSFSLLRFEDDGESCYAWAYDKETGDKLVGPKVTMAMAKSEGWIDKSGSKWKTMPELMRSYRAAAFFGRLYAPHILVGMQTVDERHDIQPEKVVNTTASKLSEMAKEVEVKPAIEPDTQTDTQPDTQTQSAPIEGVVIEGNKDDLEVF